MTALLAIIWFVWLVIACVLTFHFIGFNGLTNMFPEGRRGWHFPAQLATLAHFAAVVHYHPF